MVLERFLRNGHDVRNVLGQICWSQEFQVSPGLANVIVLRCHHGICGVLLVSVSELGCCP